MRAIQMVMSVATAAAAMVGSVGQAEAHGHHGGGVTVSTPIVRVDFGRGHYRPAYEHHGYYGYERYAAPVYRPTYVSVDNWHQGGWYHTHHDGRYGWWWVAGGAWSYYPAPVYPYPVYVETVVPQPVVQQPVQTYYFCRSLNSYYPSVPECPEPFETITQ